MALPFKPGLLPSEVAFLCEMELVTVIPRQRLSGLELIGGPTAPLDPPFPTPLPLWLALLLKRQRRANISPPPWLHPAALASILETEVEHAGPFSPPAPLPPPSAIATAASLDPYLALSAAGTAELAPPFLPNSSTAAALPDALPYHWLETAHLLLGHAADDFEDPDAVRRLVRDLREVRGAKIRKGYGVLDAGAGVQMNGVGGMEVAECRAFIGGVVDGLRKIGASREQMRKEREAEEAENGGYAGNRDEDDDDDDDDML